MRYARVTVKKDTQTTYPVDVPVWVIPILAFLFDEGNVIHKGEYVPVEGEYPVAEAEFGRLIQAYGADRKTDIPYVASAYGEGSRGLRELRRAIDEARRDESQAAAPARKSRSAAQADPLMV